MLITFSLTYYNQGMGALKKHLEEWKKYEEEVKKNIKFLIVDDGSKIPLEKIITKEDIGVLNIELYTVEVDLFCNIPGAMNLSAKECNTEWIIFLDMDTLIDKQFSKKLLNIIETGPDKKVYKFNRRVYEDKNNNKNNKIHPKVCMLKVKDFWDVGGYDEDLVGSYGMTDPIFFWRAEGKLETVFCKKMYITHLFEGESDINRDLSRNRKIFEEKKKSGEWCKDFIRFPYHKKLLN